MVLNPSQHTKFRPARNRAGKDNKKGMALHVNLASKMAAMLSFQFNIESMSPM